MKLYATVQSERATKGQGGNDYICIKLTVQNGAKQYYPIGEIILDYKDDHKDYADSQNEWVLSWLSQNASDPTIIEQGHVEPPQIKGKQQKDINTCIVCDTPLGTNKKCPYGC